MNPKNNQPHFSFAQRMFMLMSIACLFSPLIYVASVSAQVSDLTTSVDRNNILLDESIQLTLVAAGSAARDAIDFSSLQSNFRISQPSFSQSTQIINGTMSRTVSWAVDLYPKQIGSFTIPSFSIDGKSSNEFTVNVLPVDTAISDQPREFFVTSSIDNQTVYLQQQILYTVKIHLAREIQRGQLTQPDLVGAIVEQIGEDEDYQEIIDGVRYRIIERKYAIIPQASGNYVIAGPIFEADVPTNSRRSFANFGRSKTIARRASDINISVRPIPDNYNNTWLPSELVEIIEQWQGNTQPFMVGEPVTRTITLTALGLTKEQLPNVNLPYHPSFKVYPEQPSLATVERNNKLIAQGVFNSAIIPEKAGSFVLPEARIPWFNVTTGETEFAILPARTIEVVPKPANAQVLPQTATPSNQQVNNTPSNQSAQPMLPMQQQGMDWLHYLLVASNLFMLVAFYVFWLMKNQSKQSQKQAQVTAISPFINEETSFKRVKECLEQGQLEGLSHALEIWLKTIFTGQFYSISASLATYPESKALDTYNKVLANSFSSQQQQIDYREFIERLTQFRKLAKTNNNETALSMLYPK
ncbi:MAG: hypothetical protein ACI82S_001463 [Patiriisocius sp.]|jgi:hypothetical protein